MAFAYQYESNQSLLSDEQIQEEKQFFIRAVDEENSTQEREPLLEIKHNSKTEENATPLVENRKRFLHDFEKKNNFNFQKEPSKNWDRIKEPNCKRIIFIDMKIKRLFGIDTIHEVFRCTFHYYLTWLATEKEYESYQRFCEDENNKPEQWIPEWYPKCTYPNKVEEHSCEIYKKSDLDEGFTLREGTKFKWHINEKQLGFDPRDGYWIRYRTDCDMTFSEEFELESFPFDCQDFTIFLREEKLVSDRLDYLPLPRFGEFCLLDQQFTSTSEWKLENVGVEFMATRWYQSKSASRYPLVAFRIKASRNWKVYINTFIVTAFMFWLGLGSYALKDLEDLGDRLGYCVTLLLADVATQQLLFDQLPRIPYLTFLDSYINLCFIFLSLVTAWACLLPMFNEDTFRTADCWMLICNLVFVTSIHIYFIWKARKSWKNERRKLTANSKQLVEYFEEVKHSLEKPKIKCKWDGIEWDSLLTNDETALDKSLWFLGNRGRDK